MKSQLVGFGDNGKIKVDSLSETEAENYRVYSLKISGKKQIISTYYKDESNWISATPDITYVEDDSEAYSIISILTSKTNSCGTWKFYLVDNILEDNTQNNPEILNLSGIKWSDFSNNTVLSSFVTNLFSETSE